YRPIVRTERPRRAITLCDDRWSAAGGSVTSAKGRPGPYLTRSCRQIYVMYICRPQRPGIICCVTSAVKSQSSRCFSGRVRR
ncbi:hypothetical protein J6590_036032, partial [Homalodisca vitripennis]